MRPACWTRRAVHSVPKKGERGVVVLGAHERLVGVTVTGKLQTHPIRASKWNHTVFYHRVVECLVDGEDEPRDIAAERFYVAAERMKGAAE